jgi:hypothetical protein
MTAAGIVLVLVGLIALAVIVGAIGAPYTLLAGLLALIGLVSAGGDRR